MQYDAIVAQLRTLKLTGMADALEQQLEQPTTHDDLSFLERLSLLADREACSRSNTRDNEGLNRCGSDKAATPPNLYAMFLCNTC